MEVIKGRYEVLSSESITLKDSLDLIISEEKDLELRVFFDLRGINEKKVLNVKVSDYARLKLIVFALGDNASYELNVDLAKSSYLDLYTADHFSGNLSAFKYVNLKGEGSEAKIYEYVSASKNNKVSGDFRMNHLNKNTFVNGKFYYLAKDEGNIEKNAICSIEKGMSNSNSSESIKGVLLSEKSRIKSEPILLIDFDDVHANHGCAIGTLDSNEVYYLMSRGLTKEEATKIICRSLIVPFLDASTDKEFSDNASKYLEESLEV